MNELLIEPDHAEFLNTVIILTIQANSVDPDQTDKCVNCYDRTKQFKFLDVQILADLYGI